MEIINHIKDALQGKVPRGTNRSDKWPQVRDSHLKIQPLCQCCGSKNKLQVHHLQPFHIHPELELEPTNLITLCEDSVHNCHILFGHLRNFKSFNANCLEDVKVWVDKVKNRPKTGE